MYLQLIKTAAKLVAEKNVAERYVILTGRPFKREHGVIASYILKDAFDHSTARIIINLNIFKSIASPPRNF